MILENRLVTFVLFNNIHSGQLPEKMICVGYKEKEQILTGKHQLQKIITYLFDDKNWLSASCARLQFLTSLMMHFSQWGHET
jgi:hypothetical protein